jgi:glucose/arabinose dehydrogenase
MNKRRNSILHSSVKIRALYMVLVGFSLVVSCKDRASGFETELIASGLSRPVFITAPPGDTLRLFIVEQFSAQIKVVKGGVLLTTPFLDINDLVIDSGNERGLLGLAFHPDYALNGYLFVNYTDNSGNSVIARFTVSSNPDRADPDSIRTVLALPQPFANHNGGMLAFGPNDGYLYIGVGDGGSAGDPDNRAQDDGELLGKILQIDVDSGLPYAIPPDNPFASPGAPLDEIWAKGLRNPWRFSFDRMTGDLFIGDVGQNLYEEIDFQPATNSGGENYGWRLTEGNNCFNPPTNCDPGGLTYPVYAYTHGGNPFRCSVTGGYVYRGTVIPDLQGTYFFADFCSDQIWSFRYDGVILSEFFDRTDELAPGEGLSIGRISSFGEDAMGELYIVDLDGEIFKLCPPEGCVGFCEGDFDCDEDQDGTDAAAFKIDFGRSSFLNPCTNQKTCKGDFDCDGDVDGTDAGLFKADFGRSPFADPCPTCTVGEWCGY